MSISGLNASGTSECTRGRCQDINERSTDVLFDDMQLELRAVERSEDSVLYEASGRVSGIIIWTEDDEELRARWHGTFNSFVWVSDEPEDESSEMTDATVMGIAIDHVGAGIVIDFPSTGIAIDHVGAGLSPRQP